jgi:pyochelin synthetase
MTPAPAKHENNNLSSQGSLHQLPTIVAAPEERYIPFPLTDIQQAYWAGRLEDVELGGVTTHRYFEIDCDGLDQERLNLAWQRVVDRHDMLRAIVSSDGRQRILKTVPPYRIKTLDLRRDDPDAVRSGLNAVRESMSHQVLPSDQWPLFEIRACLLDDRRFRLHLSFDALVVDARSRNLLFAEWSQFYQDPAARLLPLELSFRDYVMAEVSLRNSDVYRRADDYWQHRLASLPPAPELPLAKNPNGLPRSWFKRFHAQLEAEMWTRLKDEASSRRLRPTVLLLAAFAEVLKVWSKSPRMTINMTLFNRMARDPRLKGVVGDFTSSSLIGIDNESQPTFETRALQVQQQLDEDLKHSSMSGVQVIRQLAKGQDSGFRAIMPVVFTSLLSTDARFRDSSPMDWLGEVVYTITQTPQVLIDHQINEQRGSLVLDWDVVEELFPTGMVEEMFQSYIEFLCRLADDARSWQESRQDTVRKLIPPAHLKLQASANATQAQPPTGLLHTLFSEQVSRRADHPAVVSPSRRLTYSELSRRSLQVGHWLRRHGAAPNRLVAVVMEKGWEQVVAVLGILRSGAAYLPIDPNLPKERLWHLLDHGQVQLALTQPAIDKIVEWPENIQRLCVSDVSLERLEETPLHQVQGAEDLAYVIYTSGSTGLPKGVRIDHRGAVNTIVDINRRFSVAAADRVLALSSLSFDLSVYDIFGTLAAGGTIIIPDVSGVRDPAHWAEILAQEKVTVWNSVPALMELLVEYLSGRPGVSLHSLRLVLLSGDWVPVSLPDRIKALAKDVQVISLGGATEASIWSILYPIETVDPNCKSISYGRPMMNQSFHVLDEALEPRPLWVPGQLYIGGIGLAKGYWRDEEKSRANFIHHPRTGERFYKTGDLGRYLPDGNIEFLGRGDFQVKIQGYRVELGEIEAALAKHSGVSAAAVVAKGHRDGPKRLVGYVVAGQAARPTSADLQAFLAQKLPDYMVPAAYLFLDALPLTANGKVNRQTLPEPPQTAASRGGEATALQSELEGMRELVEGVLNQTDLDASTSLLAYGATSIDMIRIVNRLDETLGYRPRIGDFYRDATITGLVRSYERYKNETERAVPLPAAPVQEQPDGAFIITDPIEREAFKKTLAGLRRFNANAISIGLGAAALDDQTIRRYSERRSHREFSAAPVPHANLRGLLGELSPIMLEGHAKYLFGSAGNSYSVQTYIYAKSGRVESLPAGVYYHQPVERRFVLISGGACIDPEIYDFLINRPVFDAAAFAVFFVAQLGAIQPLYGEHALSFATIEAGLMTQVLEMAAPSFGIGLCQMGALNPVLLSGPLTFEPGHALLHSLVGGSIADPDMQGLKKADVESPDDWTEGEI